MGSQTHQSKPPLVIFHSPCLDGFTAAWACWLKHPDAEFVPGVHGQDPPDVADREVCLLDFSYKRPVLREMVQKARSITVLDHHKTAEADLGDLLDDAQSGLVGKFDMKKSGARLAWEWFHPGVKVPHLVEVVEDRDLGRPWSKEGARYTDTEALNAVLFSHNYDFSVWSALRILTDDTASATHQEIVYEGRAILRKQKKDVKELIAKLERPMQFTRGYGLTWIPTVNLPYTYSSDAAGSMAERADFAASYFIDAQGWHCFSLRSRGDGADVSEVAKAYGGGGHKNAAGFRVARLEEL